MPTRRHLLLSGLLAAAAGPYQPLPLPNDETAQNWLQAHVSDWVKRYDLPGVSAGLMLGGKIVAEAAAGVRKVGSAAHLLPTDAMQIGSITKPMTAALVAKMIEKGVLSWNTTVGEAFPEFASVMQPEYRAVTIPLLLSHRSGMHYVPQTEPSDQYATLPFAQRRHAYVRAAVIDKPAVPVGTFLYGGGPIVVAAILEKRTGRTWEELMIDEVFKPLQMTTARPGLPPKDHTSGAAAEPVKFVWEHGRNNGVTFAKLPVGQSGYMNTHGPAGCVDCSAGDLLRFMAAYAPQFTGSSFFSNESLRMLTTPINGGMGPGWSVATGRTLAGKTVVMRLEHNGSNGYNSSSTCICPRTGNGFVWNTNINGPNISPFQNEADGTLYRFLLTGRALDAPEISLLIDDQMPGLTVEWWQNQTAAGGVMQAEFSFVLRPDDAKNRFSVSAPWADGEVVFDSGEWAANGRLAYRPDEPILDGWQHFAVSVERATGAMVVYRNGRQEAAKKGGGFLKPGKYTLVVGGEANPFPGEIREFRLWNRARGWRDVRARMHEATLPNENGLVGYYKGDGDVP